MNLETFSLSTLMVLPGTLVFTILGVVMTLIAIAYQLRKERQPYATIHDNLRDLCVVYKRQAEELQQKIAELERQVQDRDRVIAEIDVLEKRLESLQAEWASMESARREIDELKQDAAKIAEEYADILKKRDNIKAEFDDMKNLVETGRKTLADLNAQKAEIVVEIESSKEDLRDLTWEMNDLRAERDIALRTIQEAKQYESTKAALEIEAQRLNAEIDDLRKTASNLKVESDEVARLSRERKSHISEIENLKSDRGDLEREIDEFQSELDDLEAAIKGLDKERISLAKLNDEIEAKEQAHAALVDEIARKEARLARIPEPGEVPVGIAPPVTEILADLKMLPTALSIPAVLNGIGIPESEALRLSTSYLSKLGLEYKTRTVKGFHTALKINDKAQITVLAGVSGTGKSLLPRRYAEAIGMHFHQIAVEPRWDSPQDLLGFYNYIEKRFRATDLARLLVRMNPYSELEPEAGSHKDRMAIVLLDEMNLARVEYYFSDFLSRLEVRPTANDVGDENKRKDALIPMDIRTNSKPIQLFPSHNILFTGTMNDDESTQALSDKVLDRGNVLQFAAPENFDKKNFQPGVPKSAVEALSYKTWSSWIRSPDILDAHDKDQVAKTIQSLAGIMEGMGRPFGHRLRDAITAYCSNYPKGEGKGDIRNPLVDQIEYRIMPKLRGVNLEENSNGFEGLISLLRTDLDDGKMADRVEALRNDQINKSGLFVWRGFNRQE